MAPARAAIPGFVLSISLLCSLLGFSASAHAIPEDCIEQGGQATCKAPILVTTPWQYALCDDASSSLGRVAAWCAVMGGTWGGGGCAGATPPSESTVYSLAYAFEQSIHSPCQTSGSDNGWLSPGQVLDSWNCWRGTPRYLNGIEVYNLREMPFSGQSYNSYTKSCSGTWSERVIALRTRSVTTGCPEGYTLRTSRFTGQPECYTMCPVKPPTPYSPDPYPLNVNDLTQRMKDGLECLKRCTGESNVSALLDSAYRPYPYQLHLREVYLKWKELEPRTDCAALKAEVREEFFNRHRLDRSDQDPPANPNNCHSVAGGANCVDINRPYREAVDFCSFECKVYRSWPSGPKKDPPHVVPY